jgi:predicted RNA-binding Zn ribbon-like protein
MSAHRSEQPLAVDLANTLHVPTATYSSIRDRLPDEEELGRWIRAQADRLPAGAGPPGLHRVRRLRAVIRQLFLARVGRTAPSQGNVAALNSLLTDPVAAVRLHWPPGTQPTTDGEDRRPPGRRALVAVAESTLEVLTGPEADQLCCCPYARCSAFYVRRNARRRWCSDACGARVRVARSYRRRATSGG